jgi:cyclopropane fatty-acyl-phospholipid synthase-like methyltransferase
MGAENLQEVQNYFRATQDAYARWGGDTRAIHFGFHPKPSEPSNHFDSLVFMNDRLIRMLSLTQGGTFLDAGCGFGGTLARAASAAGINGIGITICSEQVEEAQSFIESLGLESQVSIKLADFTDTQFPVESFDGVLMCESLAHAPEKTAAIMEMGRIVKPGGRIVIADYFLTPGFSEGDLQALKEFEEGWACRIVTFRDFYYYCINNGLNVSSFENVTPNVLPSIALAAASARGHEGDLTACDDRVMHRIATCRIEELMREGKMGYFITVLSKPLNERSLHIDEA